MANISIEFKGSSFTLSVLHIQSTTLAEIRFDLTKKIAQAPDFFYLLPIVVDIEKVESTLDYQAIKSLIEEFNFTFVGFTGSVTKEQRQLIRTLGFSFVNTAKTDLSQSKLSEMSTLSENTTLVEGVVSPQPKHVEQPQFYSDKVHRGQIRSGQQVYAKEQNLVVIGSVSAGAEIIADGNIHVYGSLRGRAIAGAKGHSQAKIYCQNLEAELVSINGNYWLSESMEQHWGLPVYIQLTDAELTSSTLI